MNSHRRYSEMLARRAELTAAEERRLRDHLNECAECRQTAAAYEQQWRLLRSLPPLATPPTLRASVLHRIRATPPIALPWYRRRLAMMAPLGAVAVLSLVAFAWAAGNRGTVPRGNQGAILSQTATPARTPAKITSFGSPFASPVRAQHAKPKHVATSHTSPRRTSPAVRPQVPVAVDTSVASNAPLPVPTQGGSDRFAATPVSFGSRPSVAAGIPATPLRPPSSRHVTTTAARRPASTQSHVAEATIRPGPTVAPTSGSIGIASGPPPSSATALSPPQPAPVPSSAAPARSAAPIIVVTPAAANTPLPIILPTGTPYPAVQANVGPPPSTATPTATPLP